MNLWSAPAGTNAACPSLTSIDSSPTVEDAASPENDVHLVVDMRLLAVGLGRDEHVDADLEPGRLVDDLVAAAGLLQAAPGRSDVQRIHGDEPTRRS